MRGTVARAAISAAILAITSACRSTHRVDFVAIDTKEVSRVGEDGHPDPLLGDRVEAAWQVRGWHPKGEERDPEILVAATFRNRSAERFVLGRESLRIVDDEGRSFVPKLTDADSATDLIVDPGATVTFRIPFRPEAEIRLERVASIRVRWSYQVGGVEREMETKFFREAVAPGRDRPARFGFSFPFFFTP